MWVMVASMRKNRNSDNLKKLKNPRNLKNLKEIRTVESVRNSKKTVDVGQGSNNENRFEKYDMVCEEETRKVKNSREK